MLNYPHGVFASVFVRTRGVALLYTWYLVLRVTAVSYTSTAVSMLHTRYLLLILL